MCEHNTVTECFSNHNNVNDLFLTLFQTPLEPHAVHHQRQQRQMGGGRKPRGTERMSQLHRDIGTRALGIVTIVP